MNRHVGIIGGIIIFLIILMIIIYNHSDFDQQLVEQVDSGVPASVLIIQINNETEKMQINAKRRLENTVMDKKNWGNGSLLVKDDYQKTYESYYESEMNIISNYDTIRKKFARREINRREFLDDIKNIKSYFSSYS